MTGRWPRRILWIAADAVIVVVILAVLAAILLPSYIGRGDQPDEVPVARERPGR